MIIRTTIRCEILPPLPRLSWIIILCCCCCCCCHRRQSLLLLLLLLMLLLLFIDLCLCETNVNGTTAARECVSPRERPNGIEGLFFVSILNECASSSHSAAAVSNDKHFIYGTISREERLELLLCCCSGNGANKQLGLVDASICCCCRKAQS